MEQIEQTYILILKAALSAAFILQLIIVKSLYYLFG